MTIKETIECDAWDCSNSMDVDSCDTPETTMQYAGWMTNPDDGYQHFCASCKPAVLKELETDDDDA